MAAFALLPDSVRANPTMSLDGAKGDVTRLAPRVPAGRDSLAAATQDAPTRRGILAISAILPALGALPALATFAGASDLETLIAHHEAATVAFNNADTAAFGAGDSLDDGSPEEVHYLATLRALDAYAPRTAQEFVRSFSARFSNELPPTDDQMEELVSIAKRLAGEGC